VDKHVEEGVNTVIKDCIGVDDVTDISQRSFVWLHENTTLEVGFRTSIYHLLRLPAGFASSLGVLRVIIIT